MTNSYTSYPSSVEDAVLVSHIREVFRRESEQQQPSRNVLRYLFDYAAAYESMNTGLMGQVAFMNNWPERNRRTEKPLSIQRLFLFVHFLHTVSGMEKVCNFAVWIKSDHTRWKNLMLCWKNQSGILSREDVIAPSKYCRCAERRNPKSNILKCWFSVFYNTYRTFFWTLHQHLVLIP